MQWSARYRYPEVEVLLHTYIASLLSDLKKSTARWKIVFAHHPMYTKGFKHGVLGDCLRNETYTGLNTWMYGFTFVDFYCIFVCMYMLIYIYLNILTLI